MSVDFANVRGALCADRSVVDLPTVDRAFDRPGGRDGTWLREQVCPSCPVRDVCLAEAIDRGEWGVWGGTSSNKRTRMGGRSPRGKLRGNADS